MHLPKSLSWIALALLPACLPARAIDFDPAPVSSWPGYSRGPIMNVALRGHYAICAADRGGVVVLDVTDSDRPRRVGWHDTPGMPQDVAVVGDVAYVAGFGGVTILDISVPSNPRRIGFCEEAGNPMKVIASGQHLFLADYIEGIKVLDAGEPRLPVVVGQLSAGFKAEGFALRGDHLYVASRLSGLVVVDVSTPAEPRPLLYLRNGRDSRALGESGDLLCVAGYEELEVFDVSEPSAPASVSRVGLTLMPTEIKVVEGHAHIYGVDLTDPGYTAALETWDVRDPSNPRMVARSTAHGALQEISGSMALLTKDGILQIAEVQSATDLRLTGAYSMPGAGQDLFVTNNHVFLADSEAGLRILNVQDKTNPREVALQPTRGAASDVFVAGELAYVTCSDAGLKIFDVGTPSAPGLRGELDTPGWAGGIQVRGNLAFVADGSEGGLRIIDVGRPEGPVTVGSIETPGSAMEVHVEGSHAFVADGSAGFQIINIDDPANPQRIGAYTNRGEIRHVVARGDYAYLADARYNFEVVTITNLARPRRVGAISAAGGWRIALSGQHAHVTAGMFGMEIIDIGSPPLLPKRVGGWDPYSPRSNDRGVGAGIFLADGHLYFSELSGGLHILDHRNPAKLQRRSVFNQIASPDKVKSFGDTAYVLGFESSVVTAVAMQAPDSPVLAGSFSANSAVRGIYVEGNLAYLGEKTGSLQIVDVTKPFSAERLGRYQIRENGAPALYHCDHVIADGSNVFMNAVG